MVLISLLSCSAKASIEQADADSSATADDRQPGPGRSSRHGGASDNDDCATGGGCAEQVGRAARRAGSLSTPKVSGTAVLLCSDLITAQCRRRGRQFTESYGEFGTVCPRWQKTSVRPRASQLVALQACCSSIFHELARFHRNALVHEDLRIWRHPPDAASAYTPSDRRQ